MVEDQLIPAIIENQAGGLDVVAGATKSSQAIIDAVADCVAQAGGDPAAFLAKQITKVAGADETYDCDVAVVGCGAAGFVASIAAAKAGAKVVVVEKGASVASVHGIKVSGPFAIGTDVLLSRALINRRERRQIVEEKDVLLKALAEYPIKDGTDAVLAEIEKAQK